MEEKIKQFNQLIADSKSIVFFGGAGVSTESGIPDFRSKDGLYNTLDIRFEKYSPEYLLSRDCLKCNPEVFLNFIVKKWIAAILNQILLIKHWLEWKKWVNLI